MRYATDRKTRKYVKGYGFLSFTRNLASSAAAKKALLKQGKDAATRAAKRAVSKAADATGDLVGQKIVDKIVKKAAPKQKPVEVPVVTQRDFTPEERAQILKELSLL